MATLNPDEVRVGNLGSGSDYTPFLQRYGVPSTDIGSDGPYGVYHSAFDDYAWFIQNADPHFFYLQQMARVFGLEVLRMADADVLPYDYVTYAREIARYIEAARAQAKDAGPLSGSFFSNDALNFDAPLAAADRFLAAAEKIHDLQSAPTGDLTRLNSALRRTESALLTEAGLPNRPWYRHTIYAPGEYTGYAAVVIPGVTEAIEAKNPALAAQQLSVLTQALDRATQILDSAR
jgi:N-acetylated-alpha-linked acidic dipeptidase